tara:strand:- start:437 stop:754 length:318 start_codon:yes stop_codon:yes gene_type:complete
MTQFIKSDFNFHGGFLTYTGNYEGRPVYEDKPGVHPTRVGKGKDLVIARFKHKGPITKAKFLKELIQNHTVENYARALKSGIAPVRILRDSNSTWYETIMSRVAS